jgi:hypothetical protein
MPRFNSVEGLPMKLVIPTTLQMGWIEFPPYFGVVSETVRHVVAQYVERPVGTLPGHKFAAHVARGKIFGSMLEVSNDKSSRYMLEVFVDSYISLAISTS